MSLSHDFYMKFLDYDVMEEVLHFHVKGNYSTHETTAHATTLHHIPGKDLAHMTGKELPLDILSRKPRDNFHNLHSLPPHHSLRRNESCDYFNANTIKFSTVESLLAPLLIKDNHSYKRGYPSGGALYPIEVFIANLSNSITDWPGTSNILHLLPASCAFEVHCPITGDPQALIPSRLRTTSIGTPSLALIYMAYLPKALFKYRYRGYRLALMEAGSMYMLVDLRCKELDLKSRNWSGFTDHEVTKTLRLNPTLFVPLCIQYIG